MKKGAPFCCLGYIETILLHSYMGIIVKHYKDPYWRTGIQRKMAPMTAGGTPFVRWDEFIPHSKRNFWP